MHSDEPMSGGSTALRLVARVLVPVVAVVPAVVAPTLTPAASARTTASDAGSGWASDATTRTVVGRVERLAASTRSGADHLRWELDSGERVWRLRPGSTRLVPGARMEVTGSALGRTIEVEAARVLQAPVARRGDVGTAVSGSTRILVMRVYWNASAPANPTTAATKDKLVTRAATCAGPNSAPIVTAVAASMPVRPKIASR